MSQTPTGGIITTDGLYTIHTFLSSGTFTPVKVGNIQVLVVAGGGGATSTGNYVAGNAGAGGDVIEEPSFAIEVATITVTVGEGGTGVVSGTANSGGSSVFDDIEAYGGDGADSNGRTGGANSNYIGGEGNGPSESGGGGAGGGGDGSFINGGIGYTSLISGVSTNYAGGGASAQYGGVGTAVDGGGAWQTNGTTNRGGGAGASNYGDSGKNGGSGIVIVRYLTSSQVSNEATISSSAWIRKEDIQETLVSSAKIVIDKNSSDINSSAWIKTTEQETINSSAYIEGLTEEATDIYYHNNKLYFSCDTDPARIGVINITDPTNPSWTLTPLSASGETYKNAKAITFNDTTHFIYVACADGLVAKIDSTDITDREEIDCSDTDDLITISSYDSQFKIVTGTDNVAAELYTIDNNVETILETDLRLSRAIYDIIDTDLTISDGQTILNTDFRVSKLAATAINTDLRFTTNDNTQEQTDTITYSTSAVVNLTQPLVSVTEVQVNGSSVGVTYTRDPIAGIVTITSSLSPADIITVTYTYQPTPELLSRDKFMVKVYKASVGAYTELSDVNLETISTTIRVDEMPQANFTVNRKHDSIDYDLDGNYFPISQKNQVIIYLDSREIFRGYITNITSNSNSESLNIIASGKLNEVNIKVAGSHTVSYTKKTGYASSKIASYPVSSYGQSIINIPLQTIGKMIDPYEVILNDITFNNDLTTLEAGYDIGSGYKGVIVDLGKIVEEHIVRGQLTLTGWTEVNNWKPDQNKSYFYVFTGKKYLGENRTYSTYNFLNSTSSLSISSTITLYTLYTNFNHVYIGTTLSITDDLYDVDHIDVYWQEIYDNNEQDYINQTTGAIAEGYPSYTTYFKPADGSEIGKYYAKYGSAPYKEISYANGIYKSVIKYEDRDNGFWETKNINYDYTKYAYEQAKAEYNKLDLYGTKVRLTLTLDAYFYYNINLLSKINIINTTIANCYKDQSGFPLSVHEINIDSNLMLVTINCDSSKSSLEGWTYTSVYGATPTWGTQEYIPENATSYSPDEPGQDLKTIRPLAPKVNLEEENFIRLDSLPDTDQWEVEE